MTALSRKAKRLLKNRKARILFIDIETAPVAAYVWRLFKENVGLNQIKDDWFILSFCAKWFEDKEVIYHDQSQAARIEQDKPLLRRIWKLLNDADIVVAQNGIRFDMKKINARFILNGMPPPSPYEVVDTFVVAKSTFGFTSNKLEYMTDKLCTVKKRKHKKFPGFELWAECLKGNPAAWKEMRLYNVDDVVSMEELYLVMRPWVIGHPNVAAIEGVDGHACPKCGSDEVIQKGYRFTRQGGQYARFHCKSCGGWSRGRSMQQPHGQRKAMLIN